MGGWPKKLCENLYCLIFDLLHPMYHNYLQGSGDSLIPGDSENNCGGYMLRLEHRRVRKSDQRPDGRFDIHD